MPVLPRIAEVQCSRIQFQPGDRVLVKIFHNISVEQTKHLRQSIVKWAGTDVEVLIYNATEMEIKVEHGETKSKLVQP